MDWSCFYRLLSRSARRLNRIMIPPLRRLARSLVRSNPVLRRLHQYWRRCQFSRLTFEDASRLRFYSEFIQTDSLVFDVGANLGNRTKIFLRLGARVVAFEPQAGCAEFLQQMLRKNQKFRLVRKALGPVQERALMFISNSHTISSLSEAWINATTKSGRFGSFEWAGREEVEVTTLDLAIEAFGSPSFVKIDVEGFEFEVLKGLSQPIDNISIEVVPEYLENALHCLQWLETLAKYEFQFSFGESMRFVFAQWISSTQLRTWIKSLPPDSFGDLYARRTRETRNASACGRVGVSASSPSGVAACGE